VVTKKVDYEYDVFNRRVSKSIDADGAGPAAAEVTRFVYDAFGNVVSETDAAIAFLYGFTGRERDEESGLNYHRARYYETATGRWLSNDPIGFAAGDTNIQRYVGNNPVNYVDPSGLTGTPVAVSVETDSVDSGGMWSPPPQQRQDG
jgi:RHS repeat-associated protein